MRHSMPALAVLTMAFPLIAASVDGASIHFTVTGKGPKTIILVHGYTCDESSWAEQVPVLSKDYRVVTIDLPGHGKSDTPAHGLTMNLFAQAVESVRAELKVQSAVFAGHSMGTPVIILYSRLYPEHVAGLVFVDGLTSANGTPATQASSSDEGSRMAGENGKKVREMMVRGMFSPITTPDLQKKILDMMLGAPEATAVNAMNATRDTSYRSDAVSSVPALGVYAGRSPVASKTTLERYFPKLEYVQIPETGHFLMMEKPAEFNAILMAYLAKQKF